MSTKKRFVSLVTLEVEANDDEHDEDFDAIDASHFVRRCLQMGIDYFGDDDEIIDVTSFETGEQMMDALLRDNNVHQFPEDVIT